MFHRPTRTLSAFTTYRLAVMAVLWTVPWVSLAGLGPARPQPFAPDLYGYAFLDTASCPLQWLDISATATPLSLQAATAAPATDDGGTVVNLTEAFEYYGRPYQQIIVSSNGYIGFAADLQSENGGDFSNDCPLPAVPDNGPSLLGRIAVLHDDLEASATGQVFTAYLAPCPRAGAVAGEACTVVQWQDWDYHQQPGASLSFQLLLYHQSRAIVAQYQNAAAIVSDSVTLGFQSPALNSALVLACDQPSGVPASGAWCAANPIAIEVCLATGFE